MKSNWSNAREDGSVAFGECLDDDAPAAREQRSRCSAGKHHAGVTPRPKESVEWSCSSDIFSEPPVVCAMRPVIHLVSVADFPKSTLRTGP